MSQKGTGVVRRVVTTLDDKDKAVVLFDSDNPHCKVRPGKNNAANLIWVTSGSPADMGGTLDRAAVEIGRSPPDGGSVFRIIDYPPVSPETEKLDVNAGRSELAHDASTKGLAPRHSFMHRTRTVDYVIVLQGEIDMLLDDSEIHLKTGDILVQQGTNHAWVNRGTEVCRLAIVLLDAKPA
jgi:quercetin dioxygenase-like cupin family protein